VDYLVNRRSILILEDNNERIRAFESAIASLSSEFVLRTWRDAPTMIAECGDCLEDACLISLDHDLVAIESSRADPGSGLEVAEFLSARRPSCPVILHTSNHERRWSMHNAFRLAGWDVEIVAPIGDDWIRSSWLPRAKTLIHYDVDKG
jgi:hypothetical protein